MRERERVRVPLPERGLDKALIGVGAVALVAVVPMLWIWLVYGSRLAGAELWAGGTGLSALAAGIGLAMIRILDGIR